MNQDPRFSPKLARTSQIARNSFVAREVNTQSPHPLKQQKRRGARFLLLKPLTSSPVGALLGWGPPGLGGEAEGRKRLAATFCLRGSSCGLRCPCLATRASSWERPRHCPPLWNQVSWGLGWSPLHERGSRPLYPIDPPTPDMLGTARNVPKICTGLPGAGPAQQSPAARTPRCSVGDHLCLLAGRGATVSVPAAGQLGDCLPAAGRRAGRSPGREAGGA